MKFCFRKFVPCINCSEHFLVNASVVFRFVESSFDATQIHFYSKTVNCVIKLMEKALHNHLPRGVSENVYVEEVSLKSILQPCFNCSLL